MNYNLAVAYDEGKGVTIDTSLASNLLIQAISAGKKRSAEVLKRSVSSW